MTAIEITNGRPASGGYKVDVSRGGYNGRVSSEWFSRPDDEKYLSLSDLYASVKGRAERDRDGSDGFSAQSPRRRAQAIH